MRLQQNPSPQLCLHCQFLGNLDATAQRVLVEDSSVALGQVKQLCIRGCYGLFLVLPCAANVLCGVATFIGLLKVCDSVEMWPKFSGLGYSTCTIGW